MRDHSRYWLRLVLEYTDLALLPEDAGMGTEAIPVKAAVSLAKQGWIKKSKFKRWVITPAGRGYLK